MEDSANGPLFQLAHLYGIETEYYDIWGDLQRASPEALLSVLRSLGALVASLDNALGAAGALQGHAWEGGQGTSLSASSSCPGSAPAGNV